MTIIFLQKSFSSLNTTQNNVSLQSLSPFLFSPQAFLLAARAFLTYAKVPTFLQWNPKPLFFPILVHLAFSYIWHPPPFKMAVAWSSFDGDRQAHSAGQHTNVRFCTQCSKPLTSFCALHFETKLFQLFCLSTVYHVHHITRIQVIAGLAISSKER